MCYFKFLWKCYFFMCCCYMYYLKFIFLLKKLIFLCVLIKIITLNHKPFNFSLHSFAESFSLTPYHFYFQFISSLFYLIWIVVSIQRTYCLMVKNISKNLLYILIPKSYELSLFSHQWNCKPYSLNHLKVIYKLLKNHFSKIITLKRTN
jgi:hypothetical protein